MPPHHPPRSTGPGGPSATRASSSPEREVARTSVVVMRMRWLLLGLAVTVLLVPAAAITVARLVQPPAGAWVRLVSFTPYALALYVVAALLLVAAWAAGEGRWSRVAATLTVMSLAGAVLHGLWLSRSFVGGAVVAEHGDALRVMTLNLMLGQATPAAVVETAVDRDVDVLVLQEVDRAAFGLLEDAGVEAAFPHLAGEPADGAAGTVVLARRPLTDETPLATGFGGVQVTYRDVTVVAVHARPPVGDAAEWTADQRVIRRAAYERPGPAVIVGDFNATTDHRALRELDGRGYVDAATAADAGWQPTWPADGQVRVVGLPVPPMLAIDHVLTNDALSAVETEAVTVDGTDHRALLAVLSR